MKYLSFIACLIIMTSCNNNDADKKDNNDDTLKDYDTTSINPEELESSCYESINDKDTVTLNMFHKSKIITGSLTYNFFEKDKNSGTISGNMYGDTLIANYIFMSEGKASVREVAFVKHNDTLTEGYGDMKEEAAKMIFSNHSTLQFTGRPLLKVDCNMP